MSEQIKQLIAAVEPFDDLEAQHIADAVAWIEGGEEIFRIEKPAVPPKHLVVYFALIDTDESKVLLVDHVKAGLWLPAGGHVEKDEHPHATVEREIQEELGMQADFIYPDPFFFSQAVSLGNTPGHTDVDFWYILRGCSQKKVSYDQREFKRIKWFGVQEILGTDTSHLDPHMHRFVKKLIANNLVKI